jgi:putative transposase
MKYNPDNHHRRSTRLNGYDYSQAGAYFVTLCSRARECLFGDIMDGEMRLNDAGCMIQKWWHESANKFTNIELDESVIMPNHFHGIIVIVGAALCGRPDNNAHLPKKGQPHRVAPTLGDIIDWFKTMTTNEYIRNVRQYNWPPFNAKLWQRNYYEHVIRNEEDLNRIRKYIVENPLKWGDDEDNPANIIHRDRKGERPFAPSNNQ